MVLQSSNCCPPSDWHGYSCQCHRGSLCRRSTHWVALTVGPSMRLLTGLQHFSPAAPISVFAAHLIYPRRAMRPLSLREWSEAERERYRCNLPDSAQTDDEDYAINQYNVTRHRVPCRGHTFPWLPSHHSSVVSPLAICSTHIVQPGSPLLQLQLLRPANSCCA